jgi:colanic acid/amylovoran biosynthesis glycosyltransferase
MKIAYLCSRYPAVSHTFVLREVNGLRALGAEIATFSIRRADSDQLLAHADRVAFESTYAILPPRWRELLAAHLGLLARAPRAYLSTLALALRIAPAGLRGHLWQLFYFMEAVVLWRECRRRGIRHIHVHMGNVAADVAMLTAQIGSTMQPRRPWSWSFTLHGPDELFDVSHFRLAQKLARARFVVCISDFTRSQLMALSDPDTWDRLHVVHVGIPIEQFTRADDGGPPDSRTDGGGPPAAVGEGSPQEDASAQGDVAPRGDATILFIGRLVPAKGHAVLLQAAALLVARGHDVNVTIAGEGPLRPTLERFAAQLGLASRVSFTGAVGQDQIHAMYASASIFCLPSFAEGVPGVLMEAMAMRLPVVSTRITGVPELIEHGRTGLLVAPGRPDELADALQRLLRDPALARELGRNGREKVIAEFNAHRAAAQLHALFAQQLS